MSDFTSWKWSGTVMIGKGLKTQMEHCRAPLCAYLPDYLPLANAHNSRSIHKIALSHQAIFPLSYYTPPLYATLGSAKKEISSCSHLLGNFLIDRLEAIPHLLLKR